MCRIQGYPTIKTFSKGRIQEYQGARSVGSLKEAGLSLLSKTAVKSLGSSNQVDSEQSCITMLWSLGFDVQLFDSCNFKIFCI